MPSAQLLTAWKPRLTEAGHVDIRHSVELVRQLTAELVAMGFEARVADLAAASVVNMQSEPDFGLTGTHNRDSILAAQALTAIKAWADAQPVALAKAA